MLDPYRKLRHQMMASGLAAFARNIIVSAVIVFMALAGMESAYAAGICSSTTVNPQRIFNQINVPSNVQVGEVIASAMVDFPVSVSTGPGPVTPGTVNAVATFTLYYQ